MTTTAAQHTREALTSAVRDLGDRCATLISAAPDPSRPVPATPAWSVHDVAAHLVAAISIYASGPRGEAPVVDDPADLPALNQDLVDQRRSISTDGLADRIRSDAAALADQVLHFGTAAPTYTFNGGETVQADTALGLLVGEFLVHGHDIATALDTSWPVGREHVEMTLTGFEQVLPGWIHPERGAHHTATYDIRLRGGGRHVWAFRDGSLDCHADLERVRVDCHLSGDPEALLLVMYGRRSPWRAALTGQVLAWGRRPWLGLSLADRFHNP